MSKWAQNMTWPLLWSGDRVDIQWDNTAAEQVEQGPHLFSKLKYLRSEAFIRQMASFEDMNTTLLSGSAGDGKEEQVETMYVSSNMMKDLEGDLYEVLVAVLWFLILLVWLLKNKVRWHKNDAKTSLAV